MDQKPFPMDPLQVHVKDLEQRLSQMAGELSLSHSSVADLERRLHGCLLKTEADALVQRLAEAEDAASKAQATVSGVAFKAQVRWKRLTVDGFGA